jgi:diketogulonate reductase-like aldo/keto reductase
MSAEDRRWFRLDDHRVPRFVYGTAWKEDETERLVTAALRAGFVGIDTANQRKHYHEAAVGEAISKSGIPRGQLFLQTKFTSLGGQDHRLPYQADAPPAEQVKQSFARSLEHLRVDRIDSYVLHGPSLRVGWSEHDGIVWRAMEALYAEGKVDFLGVSNVSLPQLESLVADAKVKPRFVQNRCYARAGWDRDVRQFCRKHGMVYQGFSLLTANQREIASQPFQQLASRLKRSSQEIVFQFALAVGMQPLTGTSNAEHMQLDLGCLEATLPGDAVELVENIAQGW